MNDADGRMKCTMTYYEEEDLPRFPEIGTHRPDLFEKFAVTARRFPDSSKIFAVPERREFAPKSLIVRTEIRARFAEQAIFGENSL